MPQRDRVHTIEMPTRQVEAAIAAIDRMLTSDVALRRGELERLMAARDALEASLRPEFAGGGA